LDAVLDPKSRRAADRDAARSQAQRNARFVEHGLSPESRVACWQHRLTPCWKRIAGGCHLDRKMDDLIRAAGFRLRDIKTHYMNGPKLMTFMYQGQAITVPAGGSHGCLQ
jgi:hypothetical protein